MAVAVVAITQIGTFSDGLSSLVCDTEQIRVQTATFVDNIAAPLQWIRGNVTTVVVGVEKDMAEIDKDRLFKRYRKRGANEAETKATHRRRYKQHLDSSELITYTKL